MYQLCEYTTHVSIFLQVKSCLRGDPRTSHVLSPGSSSLVPSNPACPVPHHLLLYLRRNNERPNQGVSDTIAGVEFPLIARLLADNNNIGCVEIYSIMRKMINNNGR